MTSPQTRSSFAVGLIGLVAVVPLVVFGLYGGAIADAVDRRKLVLVTSGGLLALSVVLTVQSVLHLRQLWLLYLVIAVQSALQAVDSPARRAVVPRLVGQQLMPAATAISQIQFNLGTTLGLLLAGAVSAEFSVVSGGVACVLGVVLLAALVPAFALGQPATGSLRPRPEKPP